ncbi:late expression factor 10 [Ectropis obliqua nucleopolyhedrovirus]|uniref:Late expression factor 10 n=1 Tax=Ectropis obliqua nucleopolyhedrovirus TaxID=59376 RepID=A0EYU1_9ABAC|nr:late expression factor 10 [Ectropis obliqua nucleopolyhedrovirus]ABI35722.1 late expression factor 10 [Ectropis obliqua nucleopolyhedrovirus]QWV59693.1 late expression factor 10 [Ectropis obliqua nucleopolyhedrovirus]UYO72836.1 late expression factor 10 [Ectropis obliqua nucleopolyhedrovirus]
MSARVDDEAILQIILKNNLDLVDNTYLMLNVVDEKCGQIQAMCIGKIDSFQTVEKAPENSVSISSATSELQSD